MAGAPEAADPSPDVGTVSRCFALGASACCGPVDGGRAVRAGEERGGGMHCRRGN
uniref:Uncharacterized protein n=1 Tax=Musa acuminata subsp. malaccensis TaxID=214687 RepID=A0A804I0X6_MUSAM